MLAEIKGKISSNGSNLTDRLEDNLTGNVFGALRYVPFSMCLREVFANGVYPKSIGDKIRQSKIDFWADKIEFWPYDREGEIDALIDFPDMIIGIEVKYKSGLSSDDDVSNNLEDQNEPVYKQSVNQLARESRIISRRNINKNKNKILLFIADRKSCREVYERISEREIIDKDIEFGYISWQEFLVQLKKLYLEDPFHKLIIRDIIDLLKRKGFEDFKDMSIKEMHSIEYHTYFKFNVENRVVINFDLKLSLERELHYEFNR